MNPTKQPNETQLQYVKRITQDRKELNLSYDEWVKLACGYECSWDNARKIFYGVSSLIEVLDEETVNNVMSKQNEDSIEDLLLQLETKKLELRKERTKISALRKELNKNVNSLAARELFFEELHNAIVANPLKPVEFYPIVPHKIVKDYLLVFGDVHYGSTFSVGINEYSPEICKERFEEMFKQTVEIIQEEGVEHINVASLGDLIQGILRISDIQLNSISMIEQIMGIARIVANFLNQLSKFVTVRYYHTINANHSELRLLGTKSGELKEDVELLIGNYIKDLLVLNERVQVIIGNDIVMDLKLDTGYEVALTHGQHIKDKASFIANLGLSRQKHYDYLIMGHIHHYTCQTVGTTQSKAPIQVISAPSIVGSCPYSEKIMKSAPSGAILLVFKENRGKAVTHELNFK